MNSGQGAPVGMDALGKNRYAFQCACTVLFGKWRPDTSSTSVPTFCLGGRSTLNVIGVVSNTSEALWYGVLAIKSKIADFESGLQKGMVSSLPAFTPFVTQVVGKLSYLYLNEKHHEPPKYQNHAPLPLPDDVAIIRDVFYSHLQMSKTEIDWKGMEVDPLDG